MPGAVTQNISSRERGSAPSVPSRTLADTKIPFEVLKFIPQESAEHYKLAPLGVSDGVLEVGMVDPDNLAAVDALNFIARKTGMPFKIFQITENDFGLVLKMYQGLGGDVERA